MWTRLSLIQSENNVLNMPMMPASESHLSESIHLASPTRTFLEENKTLSQPVPAFITPICLFHYSYTPQLRLQQSLLIRIICSNSQVRTPRPSIASTYIGHPFPRRLTTPTSRHIYSAIRKSSGTSNSRAHHSISPTIKPLPHTKWNETNT